MAISGFSQDNSMSDTNSSGPNGPGVNNRISGSELREAIKFSDLKGLSVENQEHEKLGKVQDFAVDLKSGRIVEVIIASGGFMGVDSALTAVPPRALSHDADLKTLQLNIDKEKFNSAPKIDAANWDSEMDSNRVVELYGYYGQRPYFAGGDYEGGTNLNGTVLGTLPRTMDDTANVNGARAVDTAHNVAMVATNGDGTSGNRTDVWSENSNSSFDFGHIVKASSVIGLDVTNLQGETVGKVENLVVDLTTGHIVAVIVSSGGFAGMDAEYSAVPPSAFQFNDNTNALQLDASKDTLASSPHFKSGQWPDLSQPSYTAGVYHAYKVQPYFSQDADNTGRNVRDRNNQTLTPMQQGNSQSDIDLTAHIRREVMHDDNLSINAKNCKIITLNGMVTLRGPVNSDDEKNRIGDIAKQAASDGNVDNQLEVISSTANSNSSTNSNQ